jgi:hypothetical protein
MTTRAGHSRRFQRNRGLWWTLGTALVLWAGSWQVIYLEVTRWHHLDSRLRFAPPPVPPGSAQPSPGLPVITALIVAVAAPLAVLALTLLLATKNPPHRRRG